jgi:hypothetical protein
MAQYALVIYAPVDAETDPSAEERAAHDRHAEEIMGSGAVVAAFALEAAHTTATSVRGDVVTDGPFVDAKEVVAGFFVIEAPDLDAALDIARSNPVNQQGGGVEVRPIEGAFIPERSTRG